MVYINEWFPNPVGNDNAGEFIELYNSAVVQVNLNGYTLSDGAKKKFSLAGYVIPAKGYVTLKKTDSKLALKNSDGGLWLYGPGGQIVDQAAFIGAAPEGKSFSRVDYSNAQIGHFAFLYPTPGVQNKSFDATVTTRNYPFGISLTRQLTLPYLLAIAFGIASFFIIFFIYVTHANRNISHFFFGGDKKTGI